jgi:hypothetical protein
LHRKNSDFKNGHKPGNDTVNNERGDFVTESHSIFARLRKHFYQFLNAHGDNIIEHTEIYTPKPVPDPNDFEFRIAFDKIKRHKPAGTDQIPAELVKA